MSRHDIEALRDLARAAGLLPEWRDAFGMTREVAPDVLAGMLARMGFPCDTPDDLRDSAQRLAEGATAQQQALLIVDAGQPLELRGARGLKYKVQLESGEILFGTADSTASGSVLIPAIRRPGYHRLFLGDRSLALAVCPQRCPVVRDLVPDDAQRPWGLGVQLYSLPGKGAYAQLPGLAARAAEHGASALAISPAHAMFSADPSRFSPYSPSSRLFLNVAHVEPSCVLGADAAERAMDSLGEQAHPGLGTQSRIMDWERLIPARLSVMRRLFDEFLLRGSEGEKRMLAEFCCRGGQALMSHASYEALHGHFSTILGADYGWRDWPVEFHDPAGAATREFATQHAREVEFHLFLQWQAARGLASAQRESRAAGMGIGLIADLAIGVDPRGSQVWSRQAEMLVGASVGAPPDIFQERGQNWGLSTFLPRALAEHAYEGFLDTLRAALAHAGGLRIDHILGYGRMWLIEEGADPADGVYLRYPLDDMLRLMALEAWRGKAVIIGENLGTVPEDFDEKLQRRGIMGTSVLWFERPADHGGKDGAPAFNAPGQWPDWTMATSTTHDLPTVAGWWKGRDLEWRGAADEMKLRAAERSMLWRQVAPSSGETPPEQPPVTEVLAFVARAPSPLFIVPLEDLLGVEEQPNMPGSVSGLGEGRYPNWMQALPKDVDAMWECQGVQERVAAINTARRSEP